MGVDDALFDPPGVGDEDDHEPITGHRHELDVSHRRPGERRVLDDGDLVGERREQAYGPVHDVVKIDGTLQEVVDR